MLVGRGQSREVEGQGGGEGGRGDQVLGGEESVEDVEGRLIVPKEVLIEE